MHTKLVITQMPEDLRKEIISSELKPVRLNITTVPDEDNEDDEEEYQEYQEQKDNLERDLTGFPIFNKYDEDSDKVYAYINEQDGEFSLSLLLLRNDNPGCMMDLKMTPDKKAFKMGRDSILIDYVFPFFDDEDCASIESMLMKVAFSIEQEHLPFIPICINNEPIKQ